MMPSKTKRRLTNWMAMQRAFSGLSNNRFARQRRRTKHLRQMSKASRKVNRA